MNTPTITAAESNDIRNSANAVALFIMARDRNWTDEQTAAVYNLQITTTSTADDWDAAKVADHRAWLQGAGLLPAAPAAASGSFACSCGKRYSITPA